MNASDLDRTLPIVFWEMGRAKAEVAGIEQKRTHQGSHTFPTWVVARFTASIKTVGHLLKDDIENLLLRQRFARRRKSTAMQMK